MLQRRSIRIVIYVVFATGLALLLLLLQFPYQALEQRLEAGLRSTALEEADIQGLGYSFPWAMAIEGMSLRFAGAEGPFRVTIGRGRIAPDLSALLSGRLASSFSARLFNGKLSGRLETTSWLRTDPQALHCTWADLDLEGIPLPGQQVRIRDLSGSCSGSLSLQANDRGRLASGSGELRLNDGSFALQGLVAGNLRISDIRGEAGWELQQGSLRLAEAQLKAKGIEGRIAGSLELKRPWLSSRCRLRGTVSFSPAHPTLYSWVRDTLRTTQLDFELRGSIQQPRFSRR